VTTWIAWAIWLPAAAVIIAIPGEQPVWVVMVLTSAFTASGIAVEHVYERLRRLERRLEQRLTPDGGAQ